ncbi:MAG: caspase family protein, partial [Geminicoccaceae bacterium]
MTKRLSLDQLNALIADPDTRDADLRPYFELDEESSGPMSPELTLNEKTVDIPTAKERARGDVALASVNFLSRHRRQADFHRRRARGYKGPIIVSEGDSWFQFPILLDDVIDHLLEDYPIMSLGAAGDTLQNM